MRFRPFPDLPRPFLIAHRGISSVAPENTFASFSLAQKSGIPVIELDIHRCASGELVVIHDKNSRRTSGIDLDVTKTGYETLYNLDVGSWKGKEYKNEHIPLLSDVLENFPEMFFDIEIKAPTLENCGLEITLAKLIQKMNARNRIVVSSFNPFALKRFKSLEPSVPTGIIWNHHNELPWFLHHGEGRWIGMVDFLKPFKNLVKFFSYIGSKLPGSRPRIPWTVDDSKEALKLIEFGCDAIISNSPHLLNSIFNNS